MRDRPGRRWRGDDLDRAAKLSVFRSRLAKPRLADHRSEHPSIIFNALRASCGPMLMSAITAFPSRRGPRAITPALCWAHAGRQFFELADIAANPRRGKNAAAISPVAEEAVKRIDALFDLERDNGCMTNEPGCRARPRSPGRSTKCSGVWAASPVSCGGSASPASRRTCASRLLRWGASFGSSLAPSAVPRVPRHGHADRHRQAQRYRSAGLAGRGRPHREHTSDPVVRIAVVELAYPRRHGGAASRLSRGKLRHLTYLTVS